MFSKKIFVQAYVPCVFCSRLAQEIDFENKGVELHLGQIANSMYEWEGPVAEQLGLTPADAAAIKDEYPGKLALKT